MPLGSFFLLHFPLELHRDNMQPNNLYNVDCVEGLKALDPGSIPLVVTSPPWDDLRVYGGHSWSFPDTAEQLWRIIAPGGVVAWHVADSMKSGSETGTTALQKLQFLQLGFRVNTIIMDVYEGRKTGRRYGHPLQYIFVCSKGRPAVFHPICDVKNKSAGMIRTFLHGKDKHGVSARSPLVEIQPYRVRTAIWPSVGVHASERVDSGGHPAPFPTRLVRDLIRSFSNAGQIVLDCFSGSGTTACVALEEGRRYLGFEVFGDYHKIAMARLERVRGRLVA